MHIQWNLYPSFLKRPQKINDECGKVILAKELFIWEMQRDQRKRMLLAGKTMHVGRVDRGFTVLECLGCWWYWCIMKQTRLGILQSDQLRNQDKDGRMILNISCENRQQRCEHIQMAQNIVFVMMNLGLPFTTQNFSKVENTYTVLYITTDYNTRWDLRFLQRWVWRSIWKKLTNVLMALMTEAITYLWNIGQFLPQYMVQHPRGQPSVTIRLSFLNLIFIKNGGLYYICKWWKCINQIIFQHFWRNRHLGIFKFPYPQNINVFLMQQSSILTCNLSTLIFFMALAYIPVEVWIIKEDQFHANLLLL
jgi:hypothetical protein